MLILFLIVSAVAGIAWVRQHGQPRAEVVATDTGDGWELSFQPARKVYAHSVIPGGIADTAELSERLRSDSIAARHYADFRVEHAFLMYAPAGRRAYVSYRMRDKIYWTSYRVAIPAKELLLSDGTECARTRCGNRLSEKPRQPTAPDEPEEEALLYTPPPIPGRLVSLPTDPGDPPALGLEPLKILPDVDTVAVVGKRTLQRSVYFQPGNSGNAGVANVQGDTPEPAPFLLVGAVLLGSVITGLRGCGAFRFGVTIVGGKQPPQCP